MGVVDAIRDAFSVPDKVAVVTGGAGLLGTSFARWLAVAQAKVVIADRDHGRAQAVARETSKAGHGSCLALPVDVADPDSVSGLFATVSEEYGRVDILVNNAAIDPKVGPDGLGDDVSSLTNWHASLAVNLTGPYLCCEAIAPYLRARRSGVIVNISSIYGMAGPDQRLYGSTGHDGRRKPAAYSATKAGLEGLTRYYAAAFARTGVRVNTLTLGGIRASQDDDFVARYGERAMVGRMGTVDEAGAALLFLVSDAAAYMTGANLVVDGGWTAW